MTSARWCRPPTMAMLQVAAVTLAAGACSEPAALRAGEAAGRAVAASSTDNASRPGEPVAEPSTFHSLGVRWPVRGDANADAASRRGNRRCRSSGPISGGGARRPVPAARGYLRRGHLDDRPPRNGRAVDHLPRCGRRRDDPRWWRARAARERQRGAARLARGSDPAPRHFLFVGHSGSHFVVRRCRLEVVGPGITAINGGYDESRGFVITDNVFQGPTRWPRDRGIEEVNGVIITGAGHVVAYNRMSNLGDGVHGTQYGGLSASDIYNNDIEASTDDGIEGDYADTNVRIFRNRITNAFSGISAQPSNGGPLYRYLQCALLALQAAQRRLRRADLPQHVGAGRHPVAHRAGGRDGQRRGDAEQPLHRHERSGAPLDGRHDPLRL
jgi:hypothetical protein